MLVCDVFMCLWKNIFLLAPRIMEDISASLAARLAAAGVESGLVSSDAPLSELYERLAELASSSGSVRPCGHIFHRGDLVYSCRDCEVDSTCVLCESCFSASDHAGHNVLFHRTGVETGGCCDCGDDEAWCIAGMCPSHRPRRAGEEAPPPTAAFPPRFLSPIRAIRALAELLQHPPTPPLTL